MPTHQRPVFRESALKAYIQNQERNILPRFVAPPTFRLLWIALFFFLLMACLAWSIRVPRFIDETGLIVRGAQAKELLVLIICSPAQRPSLHTGQPIQLQIGQESTMSQQTVIKTPPVVLTPEQLKQRFHLDTAAASFVTGPAVVLVVALNHSVLPSTPAIDSRVQARIQIGTRSVLALLPGLTSLAGDSQ